MGVVLFRLGNLSVVSAVADDVGQAAVSLDQVVSMLGFNGRIVVDKAFVVPLAAFFTDLLEGIGLVVVDNVVVVQADDRSAGAEIGNIVVLLAAVNCGQLIAVDVIGRSPRPRRSSFPRGRRRSARRCRQA